MNRVEKKALIKGFLKFLAEEKNDAEGFKGLEEEIDYSLDEYLGMEDDVLTGAAKEMADYVAQELRQGLSGFVGQENTPELREQMTKHTEVTLSDIAKSNDLSLPRRRDNGPEIPGYSRGGDGPPAPYCDRCKRFHWNWCIT